MSISIFIYEIMSLKNGNLAIVAKFLKWSKFLIGQEIHFFDYMDCFITYTLNFYMEIEENKEIPYFHL